jgi:hypothetical protein
MRELRHKNIVTLQARLVFSPVYPPRRLVMKPLRP